MSGEDIKIHHICDRNQIQMTLDYYEAPQQIRIQVIAEELRKEVKKSDKPLIVKDWCRKKGYLYSECKEACKYGEQKGYFTITHNNKGYILYKPSNLDTIVNQILENIYGTSDKQKNKIINNKIRKIKEKQ